MSVPERYKYQYPRWRMRFDVPRSMAVEPGYRRTMHAAEFNDQTIELDENTWRCPVTGIIMLQPTFAHHATLGQFEPLANWVYDNTIWRESKRAQSDVIGTGQPITILASKNPSPNNHFVWGISHSIAILNLASDIDGDQLEWSLVSNFNLEQDGGFVIHMNSMTDPMVTNKNWFAIHWDNLQIVCTPEGRMSLYRWADRDLMDDGAHATLVESIHVGRWADMKMQDKWFAFIPIPGLGLIMYHNSNPVKKNVVYSTISKTHVSGHLFRTPSEPDDDAVSVRLTRTSAIAIGLVKSKESNHVVAFNRIKYPTTGKFKEHKITMPYVTSLTPSVTTMEYPMTYAGSTSSVFRNEDDTADWTITDKVGRLVVTLNSSLSQYRTPFIHGTDIGWATVSNTRTTTPILMYNTHTIFDPDGVSPVSSKYDFIRELQWIETDDHRFEGKVEIVAFSDLLKDLIERGDCTWQLERQDEPSGSWSIHNGGIGSVNEEVDIKMIDFPIDRAFTFGRGGRRRVTYNATIHLNDMFVRFKEVHQTLKTAFDGRTIKQSINIVLHGAGLGSLVTYPASLDTTILPDTTKSNNWRYATKDGETGDDIINQLLMFNKRQNYQMYLSYNWENDEWHIVEQHRQILPPPTDQDFWFVCSQRHIRGLDLPVGAPAMSYLIEYGKGDILASFKVYPPEANMIRPIGLSSNDPENAKRIEGRVLVNYDSINNNTSTDFLGRVKTLIPMIAPTGNVKMVNKFGRRIFEAIAHRRLVMTIDSPIFRTEAQFPMSNRCLVYGIDSDGENALLVDNMYLRRRSNHINYSKTGYLNNVRYTIDSVWDMGIL